MSIFSLNLAENYQPVIELYPKSGGPEWQVARADEFGGFWLTTWKTRQKNPSIDWEVGEGGRYAFGLAWLIFTTAIVFLMISPNLLDIWPIFFLVLSRFETAQVMIRVTKMIMSGSQS